MAFRGNINFLVRCFHTSCNEAKFLSSYHGKENPGEILFQGDRKQKNYHKNPYWKSATWSENEGFAKKIVSLVAFLA